MDDLISRQTAIDALGEKPLAWTDGEYELGLQNQWKHDVDAIKALPPATPQPKCSCDQIKWERDIAIAQLNELGYELGEKPRTGHWIYDKRIENWKCSECGYISKIIGYVGCAEFMAKHFKFCNHCGARMIEPQESEDGNEL